MSPCCLIALGLAAFLLFGLLLANMHRLFPNLRRSAGRDQRGD